MNRIRPWLYIGKYQETTNQYLLTAHQIGAMLQLAQRVEQPGIVSLYLALNDGEPLSFELLSKGIEFVKRNQETERTILVACGAGISRSVAFAVASLKEIEQLTLLEAYREVKQHHPEAMPHPAIWLSLCQYYNEDVPFIKLLRLR